MKTDRNKILIISAFPGMGKSHFAKEVERTRDHLNEMGCDVDVIDLESSDFHWIQDAERHKSLNPEWPENYFQAIKGIITRAISYEKCYEDFLELKVKPTIILTSSHHEVITGLYNMAVLNPQYHIDYCVVVPTKDRLDEFVESYEKRGNTPEFIKLLKANWNKWINEIDEIAMHTDLNVYHLYNVDAICIKENDTWVTQMIQRGLISNYYSPLCWYSIMKKNEEEGRKELIPDQLFIISDSSMNNLDDSNFWSFLNQYRQRCYF